MGTCQDRQLACRQLAGSLERSLSIALHDV